MLLSNQVKLNHVINQTIKSNQVQSDSESDSDLEILLFNP